MEADKDEANCREVLMDSEDLQEEGRNDFKEPVGSLDTMIGAELLRDCPALITGSYTVSGHHGADFSGLGPDYPVYVSPDGWTVGGGGGGEVRDHHQESPDNLYQNIQEHLLHACCTTEGSIDQNPGNTLEYLVHSESERHMTDCYITGPDGPSIPPVSDSTRCATRSACDSPAFTEWSPHCADQDPVNAAAHLHLLGESLTLIGQRLQESDKMVCMSRGLSLLLDSLLCAMAPLMNLTTQIPELRSCTQHTMPSTLENIAYLMPGL